MRSNRWTVTAYSADVWFFRCGYHCAEDHFEKEKGRKNTGIFDENFPIHSLAE